MDALCDEHPELFDWCDTLYDLYQRKLWHELTFYLQRFIFLPVFQIWLKFGQEIRRLFFRFSFTSAVKKLGFLEAVNTSLSFISDRLLLQSLIGKMMRLTILKGLLRSFNLQTRRI
ncbi:uncharacterized protein LOC110873082 [Helianthus annuus]|uniref:uncharacterized protein LOC110873082 n=1 Tax=Helianthus annuus TaxID=4232 RepID=UPI000B907132|nr:uncharacterized protein LOC110873082 [Helianthus annuus]